MTCKCGGKCRDNAPQLIVEFSPRELREMSAMLKKFIDLSQDMVKFTLDLADDLDRKVPK